MLLYHYSKQPRRDIRSLKLQGRSRINLDVTPERVYPGVYEDSISFFLDPVPLKRMARLYPNHPVWGEGQVLYEHLIDIEKLPREIAFRFVETPLLTQTWDLLSEAEYPSALTEDEIRERKIIELLRTQEAHGEIGHTLDLLIDTVPKYQWAFIKGLDTVCERVLTEDRMSRYASGLVHLMVYVKTPVPVFEINEIVMGVPGRTSTPVPPRIVLIRG